MFVCAQSYLTLCDPMDCSLPGSSVHGILQARILEWAAISFSQGSSQPGDWTCVSWSSCIGRKILYTTSATWEASKIETSIRKCFLFSKVILFLESFFFKPAVIRVLRVGTIFTWVPFAFFVVICEGDKSTQEERNRESHECQSGQHLPRTLPRCLFFCLHFVSFFFLYSILQQWFPAFCLPSHLSILLPQLFFYRFLLVYYSPLFDLQFF